MTKSAKPGLLTLIQSFDVRLWRPDLIWETTWILYMCAEGEWRDCGLLRLSEFRELRVLGWGALRSSGRWCWRASSIEDGGYLLTCLGSCSPAGWEGDLWNQCHSNSFRGKTSFSCSQAYKHPVCWRRFPLLSSPKVSAWSLPLRWGPCNCVIPD